MAIMLKNIDLILFVRKLPELILVGYDQFEFASAIVGRCVGVNENIHPTYASTRLGN